MCNCIDAEEAMKEVIAHAKDVLKEHPSLEGEVRGFLDLCECEIEMGESPEHEIEMCWDEIDYLVKQIND
jgi:hypothetical protein